MSTKKQEWIDKKANDLLSNEGWMSSQHFIWFYEEAHCTDTFGDYARKQALKQAESHYEDRDFRDIKHADHIRKEK